MLRSLLRTFIALTGLIALIGLIAGNYARAAIAATGAIVYVVILLALDRLGPRRAGYLCTFWYFALATGAMAAGRGFHDITIVLFPAGMLIAAILLDRRHVLPMIVIAVATAVGVGGARTFSFWDSLEASTPTGMELGVLFLLLLVSGVLAYLIVGSLQESIAERARAERALEQGKEDLEARNESLQIVGELAHRLHRSPEIEAIAGQTIDVLVHHRQPPLVGFYLLDDAGMQLDLIACHGFTEEEIALGSRLPVAGSLSGVAVREQRLVVSDDLPHDERLRAPTIAALATRGITKALAVPLIFGGRVLGTMSLLYTHQRTLTQLDLDTFQAVGQTVALAIANARHVAGLEHQAYHDSLTGLPNRAGLHRRFLKLRGEERIGFVLLDLNRFREINDALGHNVGDGILIQIASRLTRSGAERRAETFRLGGDEFGVLLLDIAGRDDAKAGAHEMLAALHEPFDMAGISLEVGASAGIAYYPEDGGDSHKLLRCADIAMYHAKHVAGGVAEYSQQFDEHTPARLAMTAELGKAIREGEIDIHYQPIVALDSGSVAGFEALVRWPHPRLGLLWPADFLPLAEATDMIHALTYWVVENALVQLREWRLKRPYLTMAINLSVRSLLDRNCSQRLEEIFRKVGVDPSCVEFELTETAVMTDPESALAILGRITDTGARLAIDDFGTGYSSLTYLRRFPVSVIKIDRTFVTDMAAGGPSLAIVRSTIQLARSLGLTVVAEGIEDRETADTLRGIGCDFAQGNYFAPPGPAAEVDPCLMDSRPFALWLERAS
ncbi:MAG TPA: GGDEF domain-containing protein [Thermoanaerobaculia bacterium]|nr:GGDEF domain-containing protein [Thermoanaerobaculia bacterium]